jgi:hypothetical protein
MSQSDREQSFGTKSRSASVLLAPSDANTVGARTCARDRDDTTVRIHYTNLATIQPPGVIGFGQLSFETNEKQ